MILQFYALNAFIIAQNQGKLQIPLVAPFPDGNNVDDIDFTMLEKVYLKGKFLEK